MTKDEIERCMQVGADVLFGTHPCRVLSVKAGKIAGPHARFAAQCEHEVNGTLTSHEILRVPHPGHYDTEGRFVGDCGPRAT